MSMNCEQAEKLRKEFEECASNAEQRIDSLTHQMGGIRGDLMRIDGEIKTLTKSVEDISHSLHIIATNTTQFMELAGIYQNFKGFGFVVRHGAKFILGLAALAAAVIYLNGMHISVGK